MTKPLSLFVLCAFCLVSAGGAPSPAPAPSEEAAAAPDPAAVERLVEALAAEAAAADAAAAAAGEGPLQEKLAAADRVTGAIDRVAPEKIDPDMAAALIAR
jgi:hypothetical protein